MFQIVLHVKLFIYIFLFINSSFLVPFDEEDKEKDVWFLDHEYLENMYTMFRKVNGKKKSK
jgi:26S proteasome regulatory subunit N8